MSEAEQNKASQKQYKDKKYNQRKSWKKNLEPRQRRQYCFFHGENKGHITRDCLDAKETQERIKIGQTLNLRHNNLPGRSTIPSLYLRNSHIAQSTQALTPIKFTHPLWQPHAIQTSYLYGDQAPNSRGSHVVSEEKPTSPT